MGSAALFQNNTYSGRLHGKVPIFTVAKYAIGTALTVILKVDMDYGRYMIIFDSQSTLLSLISRVGVSSMAEDNKAIIHHAAPKK